MTDKRPERRDAGITSINWHKCLEGLGIEELERRLEMGI